MVGDGGLVAVAGEDGDAGSMAMRRRMGGDGCRAGRSAGGGDGCPALTRPRSGSSFCGPAARRTPGLAHLKGIDDGPTTSGGMEELVDEWRAYLDDTPPSWEVDRIRRQLRTGRALGDEKLLAAAEAATGRPLRRKRSRRSDAQATERHY